MNMGYQYSDNYGRRINEVLSLRVLEFMFESSKNYSRGVDVASVSEERAGFDLSLSNADVLRAILREIPVSELRAGMPELSKFNVLPFIAHKKTCLPQCALEKLRDLSLTEDETSAAPEMEANDPVSRGDRPVHMDTCEEPNSNQPVHIGLDEVTLNDNEDELMHTNEKDEVIVIDEDTENDQDTDSEPISNGYTTGKTSPTSSRRWPGDARVKCTEDGTCLVSGSDDDESDMVAKKNTNTYTNLPSSSGTRPENVCWKCGKEGMLLICSSSECVSKVHKECSNCVVNFDKYGNFHCPVCWYDGAVAEYLESQKLMSSAKRRLMKFMPLLLTRSKRPRSIKAI